MKYYLISGEASGDLHGSNLLKALKQQDPEAVFRCWGGDRMQAEGAVLVKHYKDLAFMGFSEVLMNLRTIARNFSLCEKDLLDYKPDVLILIDYPGFNLRMARFAHQHGIKVIYYISPQVWAWKKSRVFTIKKVVDRMLVILPFEKEFYARYGVEVDYVGHPLLDSLASENSETQVHETFAGINPENKKIIALLPGSRKQELQRILPEMLKIISLYNNDYQWIISGVKSIEPEFYTSLFQGLRLPIVYGQTYPLLKQATAAIVTSGTASLETALLRCPQVICYKGSAVSFAIAKRIVDVKYIGLPNLIMDKPVVKELIQNELNTGNLKNELDQLLTNEAYRRQIQQDYEQLWSVLGGPGASARAAEIILKTTKPV